MERDDFAVAVVEIGDGKLAGVVRAGPEADLQEIVGVILMLDFATDGNLLFEQKPRGRVIGPAREVQRAGAVGGPRQNQDSHQEKQVADENPCWQLIASADGHLFLLVRWQAEFIAFAGSTLL